MSAKYYEYILLHTPEEEGAKPRLISDGVQGAVATSEKEALMIAARSIPAEYEDKLDQVEISIRPF